MDTKGGMQADIYDSMAEGVQNAAAVVCCMSDKYSDSKNCALELKFAAQTGVPIVPAMVQANFVATGWLGILTAGMLWTRMWDSRSLEDDVNDLLEQVFLAVDPDAAEEASSIAGTFGTDKEEAKAELLRLRQLEGLEQQPRGSTQSEASIPAEAPSLPAYVLVTPEMESLLSQLADPMINRVGFCGMVS